MQRLCCLLLDDVSHVLCQSGYSDRRLMTTTAVWQQAISPLHSVTYDNTQTSIHKQYCPLLSLSLSLYQWLTQTSLKRNDRTHHALHAVRRTISAPLECLSSRYYHFPDLIMRSFLSVRLLIRSFVMRGIITQNVLDGFGSGGFDRLTQYSYGLHVSQKMHQLWNGVAQNYCRDRFWWYLAEIFKSLWNRVCMFQFSCRFAFLSTFRLSNRMPKK